MKKFVIVALLGVTACAEPSTVLDYRTPTGAEQAKIEAVVARDLRDPESARFRGIYMRTLQFSDRTERAFCGEVNGKNAYGGYVGYVPFIGRTDGTRYWVLRIATRETARTIEPCP